jgi:hypothetical protein
MGWASGSELMRGLIEIAQEMIPDDDQRIIFYEKTIKLLQEHDWDTLDEPLGEDDAYDEVYESLFTDKEEEEEDYDLLDKFENGLEFPEPMNDEDF